MPPPKPFVLQHTSRKIFELIGRTSLRRRNNLRIHRAELPVLIEPELTRLQRQ